jgi:hypothetical protein
MEEMDEAINKILGIIEDVNEEPRLPLEDVRACLEDILEEFAIEWMIVECENCDRIDRDNYEPSYNEGYI